VRLNAKIWPCLSLTNDPYIDLTTRSGLKKVHTNFERIYNRIDNAYQRDLANYKIRGGIVGIFAKMCVDSILRNKLFEKGMFSFYIIRSLFPADFF